MMMVDSVPEQFSCFQVFTVLAWNLHRTHLQVILKILVCSVSAIYVSATEVLILGVVCGETLQRQSQI